MLFKSDEVTSENLCRIASRVTKHTSFMLTHAEFFLAHAILCLEHTAPLKHLSIAQFDIVA